MIDEIEVVSIMMRSIELTILVDYFLIELASAVVVVSLRRNVHLSQSLCDLAFDQFGLPLLFLFLFEQYALLLEDSFRLFSLLIDFELSGNLVFTHDCLKDHVATSSRHLMLDDSLWIPSADRLQALIRLFIKVEIDAWILWTLNFPMSDLLRCQPIALLKPHCLRQ